MLYGPPGTGKTLIARNITRILNVDEPKIIDGPELKMNLYGDSEEMIRELFSEAKKDEYKFGSKSKLHVFIFDEFEALAGKRGSGDGAAAINDSIVNQLLTMIDGVQELQNILIIATTNRKDLIDPVREGRIELMIEVNLPDEGGRLEILNFLTEDMGNFGLLGRDVNLPEIARSTEGYSGAALASLVSRASRYSLVQLEGGNRLVVNDDYNTPVTGSHFKSALDYMNGIKSQHD